MRTQYYPLAALIVAIFTGSGAHGQASSPIATSPVSTSSDAKIDPRARGVVLVAYNAWAQGVGKGLSPSLGFVGGHPVLSLIISVGDQGVAKGGHLDRAVIDACRFLIDDTTFDAAVISITRYNPKNAKPIQTDNVVVRRADFQGAVKRAGAAVNVAAGFAKLHGDDAARHQACVALGIK